MPTRKNRTHLPTLLALLVLPLAAVAPARAEEPPAAETPAPAGNAGAPAAAAAANNDPRVTQVETYDPVRGQLVTVTGKNFDKASGITVTMERQNGTNTRVGPLPTTVNDDGTRFTFMIPQDALLGRYQVTFSFTAKDPNRKIPDYVVPVNADRQPFHVAMAADPAINTVFPKVTFPAEKLINNPEPGRQDQRVKIQTFDFTVAGTGFSPFREDNALVIEGRGPLSVCPQDAKAAGKAEADCAAVEVMDEGRVLKFSNIPLLNTKTNKGYVGPLRVSVRVGDKESAPVNVTLSAVSRWEPVFIAAAVVASLCGIIIGLLWLRGDERVVRRRHALLKSLFLDRETNTYSLSKFQFYAWTLAGLFGYVYLTVVRSRVQGVLEFADVPENLPGILAVSVGTGALAVGITSAKGSKGSGEENPSLADLITSGGVVAAERVQFLVWTIVGVLAFFFLTIARNPGELLELPAVPEKFLYLMGISSAGYLGGKVARRPGPVISQVAAGFSKLKIDVRGSNLSPDATFSINDVDITSKCLDPETHPNGHPLVLVKGEQPGFAKAVRLVLGGVTDEAGLVEWIKARRGAAGEPEEQGGEALREYRLTITNPDGQRSEWSFVLQPSAAPAPGNGNGTTGNGAAAGNTTADHAAPTAAP